MESQFDALADAYEESIDSMPFRRHIEMHTFLSVVGELRGLAVLDLGCGSGVYTRRLRRQGAARVVGVDVSEGMLAHARRREQRDRLGIGYLRRDLATPPSAPDPEIDGAFDLVTAVYMLPYAASERALLGFCQAARRALAGRHGRFVTAVLNPGFRADPAWYRHYGMELTSTAAPDAEGAPLHLRAWVGQHQLDLDAYRWSRAAHERALGDAGFAHVAWIQPRLSDEGRTAREPAYWRNYLECPHALVIDARLGQPPG